MPNGSGLSDEEYAELRRVILYIDQECDRFARDKGAEHSREYHGVPKQTLLFTGDDSLSRTITISPVDCEQLPDGGIPQRRYVKRDAPYFIFDVFAWADELGIRRSWHREIDRRDVLPNGKELREILQEMYEVVMAVREEDLI